MQEPEQSYRTIGDNVYRFRVLQHMTQEELAESSNVSGPYISQIERANLHKGITCTAMINIARALGVPVCVLMSEKPCQHYLDYLSNAALHRPTDKGLMKQENRSPGKKEPKVVETPFDNLIVKEEPLF